MVLGTGDMVLGVEAMVLGAWQSGAWYRVHGAQDMVMSHGAGGMVRDRVYIQG